MTAERWPVERAVGRRAFRLAGGLGGGALVVFLGLPVVALFATSGPRALIAGLRHPLVGQALALSLRTTTLATAIVATTGTPLAYYIGRGRSRLAGALATLVKLPIVISPAVGALALLLAFGRRGLLGPALEAAGVQPAFTEAAVVMAQVFVSAPFFVETAATAFGAIDPALLAVARRMGATPAQVMGRLALPLAARGLVGGLALAWARALGEFGATLMFAGNLAGRTQTLPLAVYTALESDVGAAQALSVLLVLVAFGLLAILRRSRP